MNPPRPSSLPPQQEEELEALRSIYGSDWVDLPPPKTAWGTKKGEEGWWIVRLKGDDERVSVKLKGRFTKLYPKAAPILSIEEPENLTPNHVATLSKLINDKAKELSSRKDPAPFIFDINDCVIDYISNNHVPLPKVGEKIPTLMEERANRELVEKAAQVAQNEAVLAEERAKLAEQERLLDEKIQLDASKKAEKASRAIQDEAERKRQETLYTIADGELEMRELHMDEYISVDGYEGSWDSWMLFGGKREALWTVYTAEPDGGGVGYVKASLPSIAVQVVDFSTPFYSTPLGKKRVDAVAVELGRLREVQCENIVRIYGVKRDRSPKGWERLIICTEKVEGGRLKSWLPKEGFGEELAREYITQLLSGLAGIHRIGATQKQVDTMFTFLSPSNSGETIAKLAGTGYAKRISDLDRSNRFLKGHEDVIPESWWSPDEIDSPYTYTAKRDIWHMGVLLVQLLFGFQALWRYPNLGILLQHTPGISDSISELLSGLLHPNSKKRFMAEEALTRARAVEEITRRISHRGTSGPLTIAPALPSPQNIFGTSPVSGISYFPPSNIQGPRASRYREDFEEVEFLGKGGFGEVVKARNRLDGRSYAIKKVKLRPEDNTAKVYREVNNLSRVSHQFIVRYHACWIEDVNPPSGTPLASQDSSTPTASGSTEDNGDIDISDPFAINFDDISRRDQSRSASFPRIRFANSDSDSDEDEDDSDADSDSSDETAADPSEQRGRPLNAFASAPPPRASTTGTGTTTDDGAVHSILYIQMEFVEKQTLKEAILAGTLTDEEVWRLLGQILQALAHMSSLGIVHRDLKPSNILLDANGNVKIADFGLSTTEMGAVEAASTPHGGETIVEDPDRTSGIGTSLYIAPEVAISRSYNEKADMYSLGVIFFEMCFAFKTHMERVHILSAVRQPSITFPAAWTKDIKPDQREIVEWLLRHDPNMRPRADQLLSSPLLPSREKQKEFYDSAIPELTNPRSSHYPQLLNALFDPQSRVYTRIENQTNDYTFDNPTDHDEALQPWITVVIRRLVELLQRHGAVETTLPLFMPETLLLEAFPDLAPVRLMDKSGNVIQLPAEGLLGMARSATRRQIERIKRYHVASTYMDHVSGGQPVCVKEVGFDIISPIQSWAAEAEMLDVMDKVVRELSGGKAMGAEYEFHVSHESVLAGILNVVPERCRASVLKVFKDLSTGMGGSSKTSWSTIIGLPKQLQDDLQQICIPGDFTLIRHRLGSLFPQAKRRFQSAFDTMDRIIHLAKACGMTRKIIFRPTLARNAEFFRGGFMFECVKRGRGSKDGKARELMAFGGRYDSLLDHFRAPSQHSSRKVYGVGMSIAVEPLARLVGLNESAASRKLMNATREEDRSFGYWSPTRCDVYVAMANQVDLASRLQIVGDLWRAGISSDLQYDDERHFKEIVDECGEQNTLFIVRPQPERQGPQIKIYNVLRNSEETIPRTELCMYLRQALAEQRRIDANYAFTNSTGSSAGPSNLSTGMASMALGGGGVDGYGAGGGAGGDGVRLVLPPEQKARRGERRKEAKVFLHASKQLYHKKLNDFASTVGSSIPILGVDLSASQCHQLSADTAWITDDELWRGFLGGVQGEERKYYEVVRDQVYNEVVGSRTALAGSTGSGSGSGVSGLQGVGGGIGGGAAGGGRELKWVWLFSVREGKGFLLQPSK